MPNPSPDIVSQLPVEITSNAMRVQQAKAFIKSHEYGLLSLEVVERLFKLFRGRYIVDVPSVFPSNPKAFGNFMNREVIEPYQIGISQGSQLLVMDHDQWIIFIASLF